jgi:hypothetical protein
MNLPRISYAQADPGDATVIDKVRRGVLEHLIRPKEFPRIFHAEYGHPVGYQFSWGQIIELRTVAPNPATERYEGLTWSLLTTLPWTALRVHLKSLNRPRSHLLRSLKDDSANGIADYVPPGSSVTVVGRSKPSGLSPCRHKIRSVLDCGSPTCFYRTSCSPQ